MMLIAFITLKNSRILLKGILLLFNPRRVCVAGIVCVFVMRVCVAGIHVDSSSQYYDHIVCFSFAEEKDFKGEKKLVQISCCSQACIYACVLHTHIRIYVSWDWIQLDSSGSSSVSSNHPLVLAIWLIYDSPRLIAGVTGGQLVTMSLVPGTEDSDVALECHPCCPPPLPTGKVCTLDSSWGLCASILNWKKEKEKWR